MKVGRYDYAAQLDGELTPLMDDLRAMLLEGRYVLGAPVAGFEQAFAAYVGVRHARTVNSGTDALMIALRCLGVGPGDEVVTQANTFNATVAAIRLVGAVPVLVDCDEHTFLIDTAQLEPAVTGRTRILLPVHLYGKPTPMQPFTDLAARRGLRVVEDAAQAHGARLDGRGAGSCGVVGCFSFHPSKNLAAAGDGGAIVCDDDQLAELIRCHRELGQQGQNHHVHVGYNSKLDAIQARVLTAKLPKLDAWNNQRRDVARAYRQGLADLPLSFQQWDEQEEHVFHLFQVRTDRRDELLAHLREASIDAVVRYPCPIHLQPAFADQGWQTGQFPVAERLARELLCLPIRPGMTGDEIEYVIDQVRRFHAA